MATKTSILIFYLRLAKNTQNVLRLASWATLAVVNVAGLVLTLLNIFQCTPIHAAWSATVSAGTKCIPLLTEFICAAPVNIVTDLAILALPIPVLTGMRLPSRQKTILVFTFALGIFVTIVDVVRIYYLQQAIGQVPITTGTEDGVRFGGQGDFAWNASLSLMWSAVEVNVGMTCACIPTLKPLVVRLLPAMLYDPDGSRSNGYGKGGVDSQSGATDHSPVAPPASTLAPNQGRNSAADAGEPVSALEFLTTPDMSSVSDNTNTNSDAAMIARARSENTNVLSSASTVQGNAIYFGFVNMARPKSMLKCNAKESFKYCTIVSVLFLLWGLSYGLLNTLNNVVATVNHMTKAQTLGLTSAYFGGGYFFGPLLVGEWILRRDEHHRTKRLRKHETENVGGYKATFILGLCIYGIGTIIFWPSAVTNSYGGFMLSNFVVGFGLSVLEVGANSFMILCGPREHGETRLLLAQTLQAIGSVISGLLAQKVFFAGIDVDEPSNGLTLINVQWTYLGVTLLCVILGLFFYYMPLPEVSDKELEDSIKHVPIDTHKKSFFGLQLRTVNLVLAVLSQYLYIAAQESTSIYFGSMLKFFAKYSSSSSANTANATVSPPPVIDPNQPLGQALPTPDYLLIAHTCFAVSRFLAAIVSYLSIKHRFLPRPRTLLTISVVLCLIFSILLASIRTSNPNLMFIPMALFFFAEGPMWPLIFAIGLRGQGRRAKRAAAFITMGGSGAAFFPFVIYGITRTGSTIQTAFFVIVAIQIAMLLYPAFLDLVGDARLLVDPKGVPREKKADTENAQPMYTGTEK